MFPSLRDPLSLPVQYITNHICEITLIFFILKRTIYSVVALPKLSWYKSDQKKPTFGSALTRTTGDAVWKTASQPMIGIVKATLFHEIGFYQLQPFVCSLQSPKMSYFLFISCSQKAKGSSIVCQRWLILLLIIRTYLSRIFKKWSPPNNLNSQVWNQKGRIREPGSLTVPLTWYPAMRSLLTSQEAKYPAAPVTHAVFLIWLLFSMALRSFNTGVWDQEGYPSST